MRVPLTTRDFLERAELVYGDRIGIVDEPSQPAPSLGGLSYREVARRARALQAGLDELGIAEGERVAIVSHNAARLLEVLLAVPMSGRVAVPINFRLSPEEVEYIVGHCGARVLLVDPELESSLKGVRAEHRFGTGRSTSSCSATTSSRGPGRRRTRTPPRRSTTRRGRRRGPRACR